MTVSKPPKNKREAAKAIPPIRNVIHGSIVIMDRSCGKAGCRCQKGFKHRSLYISQRHDGKTRMVYVPKRSEEKIALLISNYRKIKDAMNKFSEINIKQLTKG
jgi:hypothetical protein